MKCLNCVQIQTLRFFIYFLIFIILQNCILGTTDLCSRSFFFQLTSSWITLSNFKFRVSNFKFQSLTLKIDIVDSMIDNNYIMIEKWCRRYVHTLKIFVRIFDAKPRKNIFSAPCWILCGDRTKTLIKSICIVKPYWT